MKYNTAARYVIDSFPVALCDNVRIGRSRLVHGAAYRGYSASKRRYFYGFQVQLLMIHDELPGEFFICAGSEVDITGLKALGPQLPVGSVLYSDAAHIDYAWEATRREVEHVDLQADRRANRRAVSQVHSRRHGARLCP